MDKTGKGMDISKIMRSSYSLLIRKLQAVLIHGVPLYFFHSEGVKPVLCLKRREK